MNEDPHPEKPKDIIIECPWCLMKHMDANVGHLSNTWDVIRFVDNYQYFRTSMTKYIETTAEKCDATTNN